jgi:hypothetical protein
VDLQPQIRARDNPGSGRARGQRYPVHRSGDRSCIERDDGHLRWGVSDEARDRAQLVGVLRLERRVRGPGVRDAGGCLDRGAGTVVEHSLGCHLPHRDEDGP